MTKSYLLLTIAPLALATVALADEATPTTGASSKAGSGPATTKAPAEEAFSTGVAKGRDRLDSATSTSALKAAEIEKLGARSLGEVLRNIPGVRVEYAGGEGNARASSELTDS